MNQQAHTQPDDESRITYVDGPMDGITVAQPAPTIVWDRTPPEDWSFEYREQRLTHPESGQERTFLVLKDLYPAQALALTLSSPGKFWG